jgi:hypothetical protein
MTRLADEAFEAIYSNIENGLLLGTSSKRASSDARTPLRAASGSFHADSSSSSAFASFTSSVSKPSVNQP